MPVLILWAVPTPIVVGGVGYYLVPTISLDRLQDKKRKPELRCRPGFFLLFLFQQGLEYP
jgi:hypothetical protein